MCACIRLLAVFTVLVALARADELASRVVILANSDDPESVQLANYYAQKRGIPSANILALAMPATEALSWRQFVDTVFNPLQAELVRRQWIDAIGMDLTDGVGRKKYVIAGHKISYLVVCRGVPLKVVNDPLLPAEAIPAATNPAFKTNAASLDGELALAALSNPPLIAFVPNPLFNNDHPSALQLNQIIKVSRLDGPTLADARRLIDQAIEAETTGLIGRSYVDIGGPHAAGDRWLEEAAKQLAALQFDGDVDRAGGTLPAWARCDAPALYFGWYTGALNGPFAQEGFKFPPGAVALHIHSFSADTLRSTTQGWVGPLVARGVTATFGNVTEPYLELTHQPQLVLKALARGDTLGDAAAYAVPVYSWQAMAVGDPLYRPFKITLDEQWAHRDRLRPEQRAYVVLRHMRRLAAAGQREAAIWAGLGAQEKGVNLAVALLIADLQRASGDVAGVRTTLEMTAKLRRYTQAETPVAVLLAQRLLEAGDAKAALTVWRQVLGERERTTEQRIQWLPLALTAARAVPDTVQAQRWDTEYKVLTAPPPVAATTEVK
ncbi:MAG: TIGR03790 family protein [Opitutus sp.]|nr:TIGR03790 family protein [Opitutus sp.]